MNISVHIPPWSEVVSHSAEQWDLGLGHRTGRRCEAEASMVYESVKVARRLENTDQSKAAMWNPNTICITNKCIACIVVL